jgi:DNA-binding transcriptional LysR family regulator
VRPRLDSNDAILRRDAAGSAVGLTMLPVWIGSESLRSGTLTRVLPDWRPTRIAPINALWPARRSTSPRHQAFLDFLTREIRRHDEADAGIPAGE